MRLTFGAVRSFTALCRPPSKNSNGVRLRAAAERLQSGSAPVTEIALDAGFNDISHFNHLFRRAFAMSPGQWRRLGR